MSSSSEFRRSLRRLKVPERSGRLKPLPRSELPFLAQAKSIPKLLLDTTVYIDSFQGRLPEDVALAIRSADLWHSTVTECELSALAGLLSPDHPATQTAINQVIASIEQRPSHRIVNPDREVWRDAGIVSGALARLQQYDKAQQRRTLNDALILVSAAKAGLTVLTRNVADFDLLVQLSPQCKALFYDVRRPAV